MTKWSQPYSASRSAHIERQPYHRAHTSLGATGHWIKEAGILAPLVIGEFVKDESKKWRYIRIASVATALLSEGMWTTKIHKEREAAREHEEQYHTRIHEPVMPR